MKRRFEDYFMLFSTLFSLICGEPRVLNVHINQQLSFVKRIPVFGHASLVFLSYY